MPKYSREEIQAAIDRYLEIRRQADAGEVGWDALTEIFTDDATFIDPAWGRVQGIENIRQFMRESMEGLDDWSFPVEFTAIAGDKVIIKWQNRLPGRRADGSHYDASGVSTLHYAGNGKFSYEEDLLNMVHVGELIKESGWRPSGPFNAPPKHPPR